MSKIKSKDLSYDSALPPFLQRLHDQSAGRGDTDRHERALARPRKAKDADAEDDGPTVVDESGETISREEMERLGEKKPEGEGEGTGSGGDGAGDTTTQVTDAKADGPRAERGTTDGLATKKRKAAKIVGIYDDHVVVAKPDEGPKDAEKPAKKSKKKAKPIKLAFDDAEEG
ncbi:hypothetical protein LTR08_007846 [Meristemomyces frigidus]|nr:hypothetical protein LTR08_007846 [Meristemomyces frigidus]